MATLVDSNVILDVLTLDPVWSEWSGTALERIADSDSLLLNAVIYAEVSIRFSRIEDLEDALPASVIGREAIPFEAAFLAGKAFASYRKRGGARSSTLPDFFIGAHAAVAGHRLLTRDPKRYRAYFPGVMLVSPPRA